MFLKRKSFFVLVSILFFIFIFLAFFCFKKQSVFFYNLADKEISAIQNVLQKNEYNYKVLDSNIPLSQHLKNFRKPVLLFTTSNIELTKETKNAKSIRIKEHLINNFTSSIRSSLTKFSDKQFATIPILSNHYEILVNLDLYRKSGIKSVFNWNDIEKYATVSNKNHNSKIAFAGSDSTQVLNLFGALTEALVGYKAYNEAKDIINKNILSSNYNLNETVIQLTKTEDCPLYAATNLLSKWNHNNLLHKSSFSSSISDIEALMSQDLVSLTFMTLSDHRTIERSIIEKYTSIYFPSNKSATTRYFSAPIIYAIPFKNNKKTTETINSLLQKNTQEKLSLQSGLAPILTECKTPDRQADDARYWIAATNSPLSGLSNDIFATKEQKDELSKALLSLIR